MDNCLRAFTSEGDGVVVFTPLYAPLQTLVTGCGRRLVRIPLCLKSGRYCMDRDAFASCLQDQKPRALILCNPQNPSGRVWTREELEWIGHMCKRAGTIIISDEIHSDLNLWGIAHVPMAVAAQGAQV